MPGIVFKVEFDSEDTGRRLEELVARMDEPIGFYKAVGEYLKSEAIPRNFANESAPDGTPWAKLSPVTVARREAAGHTPIEILRSNSGSVQNLFSSIIYQMTEDSLLVGSPMKQAAVMQFGAAQGAFGRTKRGGPIPWGGIPSRPYLGLSDEDQREIINIAVDWLDV